nr:immunoglobulin heavy chain junction region [Mus musculus]MBK4183736.1 immunoglobulin heavy chain junction region [Mus musculus]
CARHSNYSNYDYW